VRESYDYAFVPWRATSGAPSRALEFTLITQRSKILERGMTGRFEISIQGEMEVRAFVPNPLPPDPAVELTGPLLRGIEEAGLALGRLDALPANIADHPSLLYAFLRKEAVLSCRIEGSRASLSDLLLFELDGTPRVPLEDVIAVSNYVAALQHGLARTRDGSPISLDLIRELHALLLSRGRGDGKMPGQFRTIQSWIGGTRPSDAAFVPPPPGMVDECMLQLDGFLRNTDSYPVLLRAGLAHAQLETIHPFLEGNGRVGRLLIILLLCQNGLLAEPLLFLSLFLRDNRALYFDLLDRVRRTGDWEAWLGFLFEGTRQTSDAAIRAAHTITAIFTEDRGSISMSGRRASSALRVHEALKARPILSMPEVARMTSLSYPAASTGMHILMEQEIARELTGRRRNRLFVYDRYLDVLDEGT
jgi:Fic family protein